MIGVGWSHYLHISAIMSGMSCLRGSDERVHFDWLQVVKNILLQGAFSSPFSPFPITYLILKLRERACIKCSSRAGIPLWLHFQTAKKCTAKFDLLANLQCIYSLCAGIHKAKNMLTRQNTALKMCTTVRRSCREAVPVYQFLKHTIRHQWILKIKVLLVVFVCVFIW